MATTIQKEVYAGIDSGCFNVVLINGSTKPPVSGNIFAMEMDGSTTLILFYGHAMRQMVIVIT